MIKLKSLKIALRTGIVTAAAASCAITACAITATAESSANGSFGAGTEFFVLDKKKSGHGNWEFFVTPASDPAAGYWLTVNRRNASFFSEDEDHLAFDTSNPQKALYVKALKPLKNARRDNQRFEQFTAADPKWRDRYFTSLEKNLPMTGTATEEKATDLGRNKCTDIPQKKGGAPCEQSEALQLPTSLKEMIKRSAKGNDMPPELLAALIQAESKFDFWNENTDVRKKCKEDPTSCPKYKWERGLGQLGPTASAANGIDWNKSIGRPDECTPNFLNEKCVMALERKCQAQDEGPLKPYDCPSAAIEATARKLKSIRENQADEKLRPKSLAKHLQPKKPTLESYRNLVGAYNRGPRVANAYAEYYRRHKEFPASYHDAWSVSRDPNTTPAKEIGYQILYKEYLNRCYVFSIAGICESLPETSLMKQFEAQFSPEGGEPRREKRSLARE